MVFHGLWLEKETKYGFINSKGELVVPVIYNTIEKFGSRGFEPENYDETNKTESPVVYWALVKKDNRYGCINSKGEVIVPIVYDEIGNFGRFDAELALIKRDNKYGLINIKGELVVECIYKSPEEIVIKK
jgi:hypothetical protein